ncbi:hypothetical protein JCM8097_003181 [Rhodosporidiobolus ruineniae]
MGVFLRGRIVTTLVVVVAALCSGLATFFYAWNFSRKWPNPTKFTKVIKIFAMIFHALFSFQSFLTSHSLHQRSRSLNFGTWSIVGMASVVFDMWWFSLMVSRKGFDAVCGDDATSCSRKNITLAFVVFLFAYSLLRLLTLLIVFHFDVKYNETLPVASTTSATLPPSSTTLPGMTSTATTPATVARSLGKRFRAGISRGGWKKERRGDVPLIAVSMHDECNHRDAGSPSRTETHAYGRVDCQAGEEDSEEEDSVLFSAPSSISSPLPSPGANNERKTERRRESSEMSASSGEDDGLVSEEDEAQGEWERRRRERRGKKGGYEGV